VSVVLVSPNGGNSEAFYINIPVDRLMIGTSGKASGVPVGLSWPKDRNFENISTEVFKVRNVNDAVIGIASRTVAKEGDTDYTDWMIHMPARGSLFVKMEPQIEQGGPRIGGIQAGTREFDNLIGLVSESWFPKASGEEGIQQGRIELSATYVSESNTAAGPETEHLE
jgi:hypothetical protein